MLHYRRCSHEWGPANADRWCRTCLEYMVVELAETYETMEAAVEDMADDRQYDMNSAREMERDDIAEYLSNKADALDAIADAVTDEERAENAIFVKSWRAAAESVQDLEHLERVVPLKKK